MTFTYTITRRTVFGNMRVVAGYFSAATGTDDTIVTGLGAIEHSSITDKTGVRASLAIDDTTTAGSCVINGMTGSDAGTFVIFGH